MADAGARRAACVTSGRPFSRLRGNDIVPRAHPSRPLSLRARLEQHAIEWMRSARPPIGHKLLSQLHLLEQEIRSEGAF